MCRLIAPLASIVLLLALSVAQVIAEPAAEPAAPANTLIKYVLAVPCLDPDGVEVKLWLNQDPPEGAIVHIEADDHSIDVPYGRRLFLPLPGAPRWTPDTPNLLKLTVRIGSEERSVRFGLRRVEARGEKLFLNGQPLYIRGFGCDGNDNGQLRRQVTTVAGYRNYVKRAKEFGFNTMRSHMPDNDRPQAFLDACDELGLFIWAEFEFADSDPAKLAPFWNHPSVIWWCWGNEMHGSGSVPWVQQAYKTVHELDPSRLIMDNSGWGEFDRDTTDVISQHLGYYFPYGPRAQCYSSYALFTAEGSVKGKPMAEMMQEMRDGKFHLGKPMLAHETGNYSTFPDVRRRASRMNISLRPQIVKKMETGDRMAHLARWVEGSDKFKQEMDKLAIEQIRKSPIVEGFEMWMLADHGYVFSGVIEDGEDCKVKPFLNPAYYRLANAPDVLLADFPDNNVKRVFAPGERFDLHLLASVYGPEALAPGKALWTVAEGDRVVTSGSGNVGGADRGRVTVLGDVPIVMPEAQHPLQLELKVRFPQEKQELVNRWHVWVFPPVDVPKPENVLVTKEMSDSAIDALASGARVLLELEDTKALGRGDQAFPSVLARFRPAIWEYGHNLGAYIPRHPAFAGFPNNRFSDLQFYHAIDHGRKIILDDCPFAPEAIVDAIDLPCANGGPYSRKATYLFELKVGKGSLLVSGFNFTDENLKNPEVRTLLKGLLDYAAGPEFKPATSVDPKTLRAYARQAKPDPALAGEGLWGPIFYGDTETTGWNKFLDAGEEPPVAKVTPQQVLH